MKYVLEIDLYLGTFQEVIVPEKSYVTDWNQLISSKVYRPRHNLMTVWFVINRIFVQAKPIWANIQIHDQS